MPRFRIIVGSNSVPCKVIIMKVEAALALPKITKSMKSEKLKEAKYVAVAKLNPVVKNNKVEPQRRPSLVSISHHAIKIEGTSTSAIRK